ncbi:MAG TPA: 50S ribosomal protein L1 [Candidatus Dojkabacteria bacterium]|nr:50S ribosomal protein L1 [Candidatus Dojkabacteria bacterium]
MATRGKKYVQIKKNKDTKEYSLADAIKVAKKSSYSKFNGTLELHVAISLPKDREARSVKGAVSLPYSSGKTVRIYVFTTPENVKAATAAGADKAGLEDLMKEIQSGKINFDVAIATPDVMAKLAVLGKELGPKGLMPNPKTGTVTTDVAKTVKEYKQGKISFAADEQGGIHVNVGKLDLDDAKLIENINVALKAIEEVYGKTLNQILRGTHLSPTMGTSVKFKYE